MKNTVSVLALLAAFGVTSASAADLGGYKDRSSTPFVERTPTWNGWYVGALLGYNSSDWDVSRSSNYQAGKYYKGGTCEYDDGCNELGKRWEISDKDPSYKKGEKVPEFYDDDPFATWGLIDSDSFDLDSIVGGAEISYKYQVGNIIFEPAINFTVGGDKFQRSWKYDDGEIDGTRYGAETVAFAKEGSFSFEKNWDATAALKIGGLLTPRLYGYGLIGASLGSFDGKYHNEVTIDGGYDFPAVNYSDTENLWGATFGGGLEYAATERLHFKIEGRYTAWQDKDISFSEMKIAEDRPVWRSTDEKINLSPDGSWTILGGISYKLTD